MQDFIEILKLSGIVILFLIVTVLVQQLDHRYKKLQNITNEVECSHSNPCIEEFLQ
ncbi:hypothetical protein [Acinetobacter populi]|uniref:hypothetical protein n=1 Tax=Acinetobacter populi TaxID=1582270 RepID=UPI00148CFCB5|nr:hypothetical protein [Acinetobacter populi]